MAKNILLQLDYLKINSKRKHWNIYFTVAITDPSDPTKMAVTTFPQSGTINLKKNSNNEIHFEPEGDDGGSGLFVFQHPMPTTGSTQVRVWVMQSRKPLQGVGHILEDIGSFMTQNNGISKLVDKSHVKQPWLLAEKAANAGIGGIGKALANIKDRKLGFVNMDEHFGHTFDSNPEKDFHNTLSTGMGEIGWTWQVLDDTTNN